MKFFFQLERMRKFSSTRMLGIHSWKNSVWQDSSRLLDLVMRAGWSVFLYPNCNRCACAILMKIIREKVIAGSSLLNGLVFY
jgi:hypothetical protein